jgi:hypothetical protein
VGLEGGVPLPQGVRGYYSRENFDTLECRIGIYGYDIVVVVGLVIETRVELNNAQTKKPGRPNKLTRVIAYLTQNRLCLTRVRNQCSC